LKEFDQISGRPRLRAAEQKKKLAKRQTRFGFFGGGSEKTKDNAGGLRAKKVPKPNRAGGNHSGVAKHIQNTGADTRGLGKNHEWGKEQVTRKCKNKNLATRCSDGWEKRESQKAESCRIRAAENQPHYPSPTRWCSVTRRRSNGGTFSNPRGRPTPTARSGCHRGHR